jgi:hypothetical protein
MVSANDRQKRSFHLHVYYTTDFGLTKLLLVGDALKLRHCAAVEHFMVTHRNIFTALCAGVFLLGVHTTPAAADIEVSGFLSIVGGKVLNGSLYGPMPDNPGVICPCYIADYANFGTYDGAWSFGAESRIGMQALAKLSDDFSVTAQVTARGTDARAQLQWAYASYVLSPTWDLQIGRKRIPLYFYSDFQDVGVTYPWVGLPPEVYGWEAANYNGVSLRNRTAVGDVYLNSSVFGGSEEVRDSRYMQSYGQHRTDVRWNNILGVDLELSKGSWTLRGVAIQADTEFNDKDTPANDSAERMKAYAIAANIDFNNWFVLSEIATNARTTKYGALQGLTITVPAVSIGVGYRRAAWTGFLNYSHYQELSSDTSILPNFDYRHASLTVKYDLSPRSVIKTQIDHYWEPGLTYSGAANVLRISYDRTF